MTMPADEFADFLQELGERFAEALPEFRRQNPETSDEQLRQWLLQCLDDLRRNAMN